MATTLASLIDRVEALLMDSSNLVFDTGTITEGIRLALGEYNLARETASLAAVTLDGLDLAAATTLSSNHDTVIVIGAAGFSTSARSADRVESFELQKESQEHLTWAEKQLATFRDMLGVLYPSYSDAAGALRAAEAARAAEAVRVAGLRTTTDPMFATWADG